MATSWCGLYRSMIRNRFSIWATKHAAYHEMVKIIWSYCKIVTINNKKSLRYNIIYFKMVPSIYSNTIYRWLYTQSVIKSILVPLFLWCRNVNDVWLINLAHCSCNSGWYWWINPRLNSFRSYCLYWVRWTQGFDTKGILVTKLYFLIFLTEYRCDNCFHKI